MSAEQQRKVSGFTLHNQYGEIFWEEDVDISGIDFSKEVNISDGVI
jgi:hypothetical protein